MRQKQKFDHNTMAFTWYNAISVAAILRHIETLNILTSSLEPRKRHAYDAVTTSIFEILIMLPHISMAFTSYNAKFTPDICTIPRQPEVSIWPIDYLNAVLIALSQFKDCKLSD